MSQQQPTARLPRDHALWLINTTGESLSSISTRPDGRPRDLDGPTATGALIAWSGLAIASAIVALADAVKESAR
ncbi:hypothetical protein [Streptomyces neyagawaensis]|uniref:hypothetical protein n=1 Tax=Streptomyces neyagawaensis TaxID=42238 RepID=UPI0006E2922F|nr:hypothetical protein [Streptomyces neyagawaensis]MCL6734406.1 hypothetical protein [Streptomyces neyagawaensis]MDE1682035.1 hypothetical protein [Streptomyces neyagawaensis]